MTFSLSVSRVKRHSPLLAGIVALVAVVRPAPAADSKPVAKDHAEKMAKGLGVFKEKVRPLLANKCLRCHGGKSTESEFDLHSRAGLLRGGLAGPAVVPGSARESLLYKLITHAKEPPMPYGSRKLSDEEIKHVAEWIDLGAPYDRPLLDREDVTAWTRKVILEATRRFWSFRPLKRVDPPAVKGQQWVRTPLDRFILAKLEQAGIAPNAPVDKRRLIRRAYLDLIGMPPTPEEVAAFLKDDSADAFEKVIDRLLSSPRYGERWARHWLDLARFAESHGFEHDYDRPSAYHYRDFVIEALNRDLPYDKFVKWQIAGDEMAPNDPLALKATGFLAAGVHSTQITQREVEKHRYDELDDMVATVGTAMLGLTIGCARCHDHKYDPIPQADYYRLVSTFTTTVRSEIELPPGPDVHAGGQKTKNGKVKVLISTEGLPAVRLHTQGGDFLKHTHFLKRGDPDQKHGVAEQGFLQVLMTAPEQEKHWPADPPEGWRTSYRRTALANWITDTEHGAGHLLARVIVNRLWQHHMGRGIVATPNDFGMRGEPPTHPELLDYLAAELIDNGWRLKPIHKLIMSSAVYAQSSRRDEAKAAKDPDNTLLWRRPVMRLEAEAIRDSMLSVGGVLDGRMFGPGTLDESSWRRSIYFTVKRSKLIPMLQVFDSPDALTSMGDRSETTVAPQALLLMNNPHVRAWAKGFARRIAPTEQVSIEQAVTAGYEIALTRPPTKRELADSVAFVRSQTVSYAKSGTMDARRLALADFCQVLMCLNEFMYVD